jgi:hypothetical protein
MWLQNIRVLALTIDAGDLHDKTGRRLLAIDPKTSELGTSEIRKGADMLFFALSENGPS